MPLPEVPGYEVLRTIGRGGMGVVYEARHLALNRTVALKMLSAEGLGSAREHARFRQEAELIARLQHPGIVQVHDIGRHEGRPFLALEYCPGGSLSRRLRELDGPLSPGAAARVVEGLARAVEYAHQRGVVHRDLKPSNVLLVEGSPTPPEACQLKVTDFGLAKDLGARTDFTRSGTFLGTPGYMAPEQIDGNADRVGPRTDVYALGAILYELMLGRPPFQAVSEFDTLWLTVHSEPIPPRHLQPGLPRDLETVCLKCLEKDPAGRYPAAAALGDDLGRWLRGEPLHARPVGPFGRFWRLTRRYPGAVGLTAALLLAVAAGMIGVLTQWRRAEIARRDAVASDKEALQLLAELVRFAPAYPFKTEGMPKAPDIELLKRAETYCIRWLEKNLDDAAVRVALTRVRGDLGVMYCQSDQWAEAEVCFRNAADLWEPMVEHDPSQAEWKDWLATTYYWQISPTEARGDRGRVLALRLKSHGLWQEVCEAIPDNLVYTVRMEQSYRELMDFAFSGPDRGAWLRPLQDDVSILEKRLQSNPTNRVLRSRLALTWLLLGEIHHSVLRPSGETSTI
jgi:tRNA A-37 threonylcarbamoyl transferase component Bud32